MFIAVNNNTENDRMSGMLFGHLLTAIIGIPFIFFTENTIDSTAIICLLVLGVVQLGIPYVLYALASKDCSPLACSLIGMLEPILNPIWVLIFDGETPGFYALIGGIIVVAAVTVWCVIGEDKKEAS
jgi:drug/metabolite transporter (DMT)-like permease